MSLSRSGFLKGVMDKATEKYLRLILRKYLQSCVKGIPFTGGHKYGYLGVYPMEIVAKTFLCGSKETKATPLLLIKIKLAILLQKIIIIIKMK